MTTSDATAHSGSNDLPITIGAQLTTDRTIDTDVCVVGSGCGGASLACRLAEAGVRVVVVEQGGYWGSRDFDQRELHMLAKIDGGRGLDTSADGGAVSQGCRLSHRAFRQMASDESRIGRRAGAVGLWLR